MLSPNAERAELANNVFCLLCDVACWWMVTAQHFPLLQGLRHSSLPALVLHWLSVLHRFDGAGGATGFAIGGYRYINLPADPAFSTLKLKTNRLINTSGAVCAIVTGWARGQGGSSNGTCSY